MVEIMQVAQGVTDLGRAQRFYEDLLGAPAAAVFDPPGLVFFRLGTVRLLLERGAPSALIYLGVPDVTAEVERCRGSGVEVVSEPHVIFRHTDNALGPADHEEWMAFVRDSEGNLVGLVSHQRA